MKGLLWQDFWMGDFLAFVEMVKQQYGDCVVFSHVTTGTFAALIQAMQSEHSQALCFETCGTEMHLHFGMLLKVISSLSATRANCLVVPGNLKLTSLKMQCEA